MSGHGTVITGASAQGDCELYVSDNGGSGNYSIGTATMQNDTGTTVSEGDVVAVDWNSSLRKVCGNDLANKATGEVSMDGTMFIVTNAGNSGLEGEVEIDLSGDYGSNGGFAGETNICAGNVNGKAAFLS